MKGLRYCIGILLLVTATWTNAQENESPFRDAPPPSNSAISVDRYHATISRSVIGMTDRIDRFFADERIIEESDKTLINLGSRFRYEDGQDLTVQVSLRGRLVMPNLKERVQLIFDSDDKERDVKSGLDSTTAASDETGRLTTGIRYVPKEYRHTRLSLDGGLRWHNGPNWFVRGRARREFDWDPWVFRWTQQLFWYQQRGVGERTIFDFDRWLDSVHFFRSSFSATWAEFSEGIDLQQVFTLYHYLSRRRMIGFNVLIEGHTRPSTEIEKYEATFHYRRAISRDWFYVEIAPGVAFPRYNDFDLTPVVILKIDVLFGDYN